MTGHHLVLVGLMGAGKTTVGRECATRLERPFVDTDDVVVALAGMPFAGVSSRRTANPRSGRSNGRRWSTCARRPIRS